RRREVRRRLGSFRHTPGHRGRFPRDRGLRPDAGSERGHEARRMIPAALMPALQGVIPSHIATCSADGVPNVTALSQVFFVDDGHVALSQQFFSKTKANLLGNPFAVVQLIHPETAVMWILDLRFLRSESEGALFDAM